jgi:hypothetical protein
MGFWFLAAEELIVCPEPKIVTANVRMASKRKLLFIGPSS